VERANDNEAITRLPVLVLAEKGSGDGWVTTPDPNIGLVHGEKLRVLKRYPVRVLPVGALQQFLKTRGKLEKRAKFEAEFGHVPEDFAQQLVSTLSIAGAAREHDLRRVAALAEKAAPKGKLAPSWAKVSAVVSPWDNVAATLNTGLFGAMPVIWQKESRLAPALLCRTLQMALFAHAMFAAIGKFGLGFCRRCGNPFFASRKDQTSCSYRCRAAEAMRRYRASLKEKGESQSRKRGRRTQQ